jgi:hypothetical protein
LEGEGLDDMCFYYYGIHIVFVTLPRRLIKNRHLVQVGIIKTRTSDFDFHGCAELHPNTVCPLVGMGSY